jgi:pimeloyl-ACP methyl ester carboxylesterase
MIYFLYRCLLRFHPHRFRERFADEMLSIFDHAEDRREVVKLLGDGLSSLVRQWTLRSEFWKKKGIESVYPSADGVPVFYTFDSFKPCPSALIDGSILTVVAFCAVCLVLRYNWTHPPVISFARVEFATSSDMEPLAGSRTLSKGTAVIRLDQQAMSPHRETVVIKEALSSPDQTVPSWLQTPAALSRIQRHGGFGILEALSSTVSSSRSPILLSNTTLYGPSVDSSPHVVRFIQVASNVKLEVLDWGGRGRPLVLLAGLENTAHVFDNFAPKLTTNYHVYGITRRGFGASSVPPDTNGNYTANRLGDDVLAVIDSLGLNRPVLVGHSIAGEELSSIGSRHPDKVAALVYLDAGYSYAFYDRSRGDLILDSIELRGKLEELVSNTGLRESKQLAQELLTSVPRFERQLREYQSEMQFIPASRQLPGQVPVASRAIVAGEQKFTDIRVPILAIFAVPHDLGIAFRDDPIARAAAEATDASRTETQARAFEISLPTARVVRMQNANHFVFRSNEADVLHEMNAFLGTLR